MGLWDVGAAAKLPSWLRKDWREAAEVLATGIQRMRLTQCFLGRDNWDRTGIEMVRISYSVVVGLA